MKINLTRHSEQLIREELVRGRFRTAEEVIEHALTLLNERQHAESVSELQQFDAVLDALAVGSDELPSLPDQALTRQGIYEDAH